MSRPRLHDLDDLLDVAERLVTDGDPAGLTLRTLATTARVPTGSIYHAFTSKDDLLARLWLRAAARLGTLQDDALGLWPPGADGSGREAIVAVALAPVRLAQRHPESARLFFAQRRDQLFSTDLPEAVTVELTAAQRRLVDRLVTLAHGAWDRTDRVAVDAVTACIVDVPTGLLRRVVLDGHRPDDVLEARVAAAVGGILGVPLDPPPVKRPDRVARSAAEPTTTHDHEGTL